jgi:hypothetical protein
VLNALDQRVQSAGAGGKGGAEQGIHPGSPEAYSSDPDGPTHDTAA